MFFFSLLPFFFAFLCIIEYLHNAQNHNATSPWLYDINIFLPLDQYCLSSSKWLHLLHYFSYQIRIYSILGKVFGVGIFFLHQSSINVHLIFDVKLFYFWRDFFQYNMTIRPCFALEVVRQIWPLLMYIKYEKWQLMPNIWCDDN